MVADLDTEDAEALVATGVPVLGYYSHVEVETRRAAEAAGVDLVRPALADGPRAAGAGRVGPQPGSLNAASTSQRAFEQAVLEVPGGPFVQHPGVQRGGLEVGPQEPQLGGLVAAVERRDRCEQVVECFGGVFDCEFVAAGGRFDHLVDQVRVPVDRLLGGGEDQLRIGRSPVSVDLEDVLRHAAPGEGDALGVPEPRRRIDLAGGQRRDGVEPDRDPVDLLGVTAVGAHLGVDDGFVGGQPGDADGAAVELAGSVDRAVGRRDHRRQRPLHDRHRADDVEALLAGDPEVVDVEDREVGAPGRRASFGASPRIRPAGESGGRRRRRRRSPGPAPRRSRSGRRWA